MPNAACDQDKDIFETTELCELVEEYDTLFELCMTAPLDNEDQKRLDGLYEALMLREQEYWEGVSDRIMAAMSDHYDIDFPMIRYLLGFLTD